jgi:hypothetical protein
LQKSNDGMMQKAKLQIENLKFRISESELPRSVATPGHGVRLGNPCP